MNKKTTKRICFIYLINPLVVPVRINPAQFAGDPVVFAQEDGVQRDQHDLLVDSAVAGHETKQVAAWPFAAAIGVFRLGRQKILQALVAEYGVAPQEATLVSAQFLGRLWVRSVNETGVEITRHRIECGSRTFN